MNPFKSYVIRLMGLKKEKLNPVHELVNVYFRIRNWDKMPKTFYVGRHAYPKLASEAKRLLAACNGDLADAMWSLDKMKYLADKGKFDWSIITCLKHNLRK